MGIIAEPKGAIQPSQAQMLFPPRERDQLMAAGQVVVNLWNTHLNENGKELLCSAAGAESVSRAVKMLECANSTLEKQKQTQFCVRPNMVREEPGAESGSDGE